MTRAIRDNYPADEVMRLGRAIEASVQQLCLATGTPAAHDAADVSALLDAAHNETAHISLGRRPAMRPEVDALGSNPRARRPEDRQPPLMGGDGTRWGSAGDDPHREP